MELLDIGHGILINLDRVTIVEAVSTTNINFHFHGQDAAPLVVEAKRIGEDKFKELRGKLGKMVI
jgi:hypothetical protein